MLLAILLLCPAQDKPKAQSPKAKTGWEWQWDAGAEFAYDDNIWLLEDSTQSRLRDELPGDQLNGRYDDMETTDDFILTPSLTWDGTGPSPFGRRIHLGAGLELPVYTQNSRRTYLEFNLGIGQDIGSNGRLGLSFQFIPKYFRKNYLASAVDNDGNGDVQQDERVYEAANYREWEVALEYRHKIIDRTDTKPFGLTGIVELSYGDRSYNSPFGYRDEQGTGIQLSLGFQYGPRVKWGVHYQYVMADSPGDIHVVLFNEILPPATDANGDGFFVNNAETYTKIDRSHKEHEIGLSVGVELSPKFEVELAYEWSRREFESDNPFDIEHVGREDLRDSFEGQVIYKISKTWQARLGFLLRDQESDLDDPEAGDDGDYERFVIYGSIHVRW